MSLPPLHVAVAFGLLSFCALSPVLSQDQQLDDPALAGALAEEPTGPRLTALPLEGIDVVSISPIDLEEVRLEDDARAQQGLAPRYAIPHAVHISPDNSGTWEMLRGDAVRWRLRVSAPEAASINLGFGRYQMPPGGRLFVYAHDFSEVIRSFTEEDNEEHGQLWTPVVRSDEIVIEVTLGSEADIPLLDLELSSINYGYRGFGAEPSPSTGAPRSGSCNVDVICPEGDGWRLDIPAIAVISTGGSTFCTGFMVNNTAADEKPFFMTANHCGINSGNAASLVVFWNYENSFCRPPGSGSSGGPGDGTLSQFQTGSFWRSSYSPSDFTLVELDDAPNPAWNLSYAGWDRSGADATSAIAIHQPSTDEKRISFENDPTTTTSYLNNGVPGDGTHVRITDWDLGTTEPGSSGSPLFDQDHRVIGQLHGGFASCASQTSDWYGRFSVSWAGGGSSSTRLSNWLDPLGTGAMTVDTLAPWSTAFLSIGFPNGLPGGVPALQPTDITVEIIPGDEVFAPGSGFLHYRYDGGSFQSVALTPLGGDLYQATLPAAACADTPEYYFSADGDLSGTVFEPQTAPAETFSTFVGELTITLDDDFETDQGWTVENVSLTDGAWDRGVPVGGGDRGDPADDFDGSGQCFLTDNVDGNSDVDGGPTRLISPALDLTGTVDPQLTYARWFTNDDLDADRLDVEISDNNGGTWVLIESVPDTVGWVQQTVRILDFVSLTDQVKLRFSATDTPNNSLTESAIDAVKIEDFFCVDIPCRSADVNNDGDVNGGDIARFVTVLVSGGGTPVEVCAGDLENVPDGTIDMDDLDNFLSCLLAAGCP